MDIRNLTGSLSVAPQINVVDLKELSEAGFRAIPSATSPMARGRTSPNFSRSSVQPWTMACRRATCRPNPAR